LRGVCVRGSPRAKRVHRIAEGEARDGKWALPKHIFDLMKRIDEDTMKFYDGAYLDTKTSTNVMEGE